jgi:uncharacterized membrane-anchored protein YhcB (DUF1043 family)
MLTTHPWLNTAIAALAGVAVGMLIMLMWQWTQPPRSKFLTRQDASSMAKEIVRLSREMTALKGKMKKQMGAVILVLQHLSANQTKK